MKMVFKNIPEEKRSFGKPRKRWLDDVNYLKKKRGGGEKQLGLETPVN